MMPVIIGIKIPIKSIIYNALILLGYFYLFDFIRISVEFDIVTATSISESKMALKMVLVGLCDGVNIGALDGDERDMFRDA